MADEKPKTGHFCWNELMTRDVDAAKTFYSGLLGWVGTDMPMGDAGHYTVFKKDGKDIGGMMAIAEEWGDVPPHWMAYITVENVDESAKKATELGARIIVPPMDIPTVGRFCTITDPTGAAVSLITFVVS
ncbi:MAG: VOC family protein [candidate division Zixibacteria bacterium]|nr:VOC family protein [candidate division Zixibacteria bacterium]